MAVDITFEDQCCIVTLNRPEALNALNADVITGIDSAFDQARASDARAVIITGTGDKAFCAGADIKELRGNDVLGHKRLLERGQRVMDKLEALPVPSIAAVNGYAFGGGLEMALACTFRIATPNAKVGLPEIKLGLTPGYGGTQRLPRVIGEARALEIVMSGRTVDAEEALAIGLVSRIVDGDAVGAAKAFAAAFTGFSLPVLALARDAITSAADLALADGLAKEADIGALAFSTQDAKEGMAAFEEKRKAAFSDA